MSIQEDIMSDYIKELGIDSSEATPVTEVLENNPEDFVQDSNTEESGVKEADGNTEPDISLELKKQIEGLEKRIGDKDDYINKLRDESKALEESNSTEEVNDTTDDFWDDPEQKFKDMQETMRVQAMQIAETQYANSVDDYWKTVNQDALQKAVATDTEFQAEFNKSNDPYRVAYEYLSKQTKDSVAKDVSLRESIRQEILKEMGVDKDKPKQEGVPNMGSLGGSNGSKSEAVSDGFASVFK